MTEASRQPKDKNYNLITVLYQSSDNVESLKTYIQDAQSEGDQELVDFFSGVLENDLEAAQRAKEMLVPRFQRERERERARVENRGVVPGRGPKGLRPLATEKWPPNIVDYGHLADAKLSSES
jgi:hypothetical protein